MSASELIERVAEVLDRGATTLSPAHARTFAELSDRLRQPVRIAIIGRVKAGKSTMVNALLEQRVAPTDVSECTKVVTWFHYGHPQRLVAHLRDGSTAEMQLAAGGLLPPDLGIPVEQIASLHAFLANDTLKAMTLIDTPGLGSVNRRFSSSTEELLAASRASTDATDRADAVVFVMNQVVMDDELETLAALRDDTGSGATVVASALGVLSRADQLGDGTRDAWEVAVELADHFSGLLHDDVATVVPVVGLMAEASAAATITESDVTNLAALAEMDPKAFTRLTWSADRFLAGEAPVSVEQRQRLLDALALYGVTRSVGLLREGARGAGELRRELGGASGIAAVKKSLTALFRDQDHVLKVRSALAAATRVTYQNATDPGLAAMRADLEALRLDPVMHPIAELEAYHAVSSGRLQLPETLREDLRRLVVPGSTRAKLGLDDDDPSVWKLTARDGMVRWRTFLNTEATPAQQAVARVVMRSYQLIWSAL